MMKLQPTTLAWIALLMLSLVSIQAAGQSHAGTSRMAMTFVIAIVAWIKALIVIRYYLESRFAGPVFHRIMLIFASLAPLALMVSGLREL
ncbi:hypothetical protein DEH84_02175 [Aquabacterium olei]|uniref:Cytochrome C oxidase subunit IV n=1 Tax=Aquabacterium olei TaxID=1296669 RepID=A0A2U8FN70_9BURK|nr:hypothetical protein [Aquabacterium olei]AWI52367.1 hypothetical protein DEH84_02175 [Aquabacterium olei]